MEIKELLIILIPSLFAVVAAIIGALVSTERIILTDLFRWHRKLPRDFVILINGSSGVGKTTIAWAIARKYNIPYVVGSDIIREILRKEIELKKDESRNIILESSFTSYESYKKEIVSDKIVEAFVEQSKILAVYIQKIIERILSKRDPVIIEGVNIIASDFMSKLSKDSYSKLLLINLYLESNELHNKRIRERGVKSLESPSKTERYLNNLNNIRKIDIYLRTDAQLFTISDAKKISNTLSIENSGSISSTIKSIDKLVKEKIRLLKKNKLI